MAKLHTYTHTHGVTHLHTCVCKAPEVGSPTKTPFMCRRVSLKQVSE